MPHKIKDYSKAVIYKIIHKDPNIKSLFIGSTTNMITKKQNHLVQYNNTENKLNLKLYKFIKDNGGWDNFLMLLIEKYPCTDGDELRARERYHIETMKADLNYGLINVEDIAGAELINGKLSLKCECGGKYTSSNKCYHYKTKRHIIYLENKEINKECENIKDDTFVKGDEEILKLNNVL